MGFNTQAEKVIKASVKHKSNKQAWFKTRATGKQWTEINNET